MIILLLEIIAIASVCAVIMHKKIRELLKSQLSIDLSFSTFLKSVAGLALVSIISLIPLLISLKSSNSSKKPDPKVEENTKVRVAFSLAKEAVKKELKCPLTAQFATGYDEESKYKINADESIVIQSYVDAQNSFGATMRNHFRCTVDKYGKVNDLTTW